MNDDRFADLLFEVLGAEVRIDDNRPDFNDWKYLIDHELVEHSKHKGALSSFLTLWSRFLGF